MKITLLAIGKARGPEAEWSREYLKRLGASVTLHEFTVSKTLSPAETQKAEAALLLKAVTPRSYIVVLDERGRDLTSRELSAKLLAWHEQAGEVTFVIGGADGLTDEIRRQANFVLCLGRLTWPHRLVRVMVLEQLYRAQQIVAGHPYHRE